MHREIVSDLLAFFAVARERSFTKAAAKMGVSQSALSHTIRGLEARLGVRLVASVGTRFEEIEAELDTLNELRDKPAGVIRLTAGEHAVNSLLLPALAKFLPRYPDIQVEVTVDHSLVDIVAQRYDAGVRFGEQVAKGMIAVRIGPDIRMAVVGSPSYFENRSAPRKPQDLTEHNCINFRQPTHGGLYAWEFEKGNRELKVRVEGQVVLNGST